MKRDRDERREIEMEFDERKDDFVFFEKCLRTLKSAR